jgi:thioesterase domain-containing protein
MGGKKSLGKQLVYVFNNKVSGIKDKLGLVKKTDSDAYYALLDSIIKRYFTALDKYQLEPVNHTVYLFKADFNDHYNSDEIYLGWKKYTTKEVKRYLVPGNHLTMMALPHVPELGKALQEALNEH